MYVVFSLFIVGLMFEGSKSKGWNLELGTWKGKVEACKPLLKKSYFDSLGF
jgi:hypothetical protein